MNNNKKDESIKEEEEKKKQKMKKKKELSDEEESDVKEKKQKKKKKISSDEESSEEEKIEKRRKKNSEEESSEEVKKKKKKKKEISSEEESSEKERKKKKKKKKELSSEDESSEEVKKKKKKKKELSSEDESSEEVKKKKKKKKELSSEEEEENEKIYIKGIYEHKRGKQSIEDFKKIIEKSRTSCKILLEDDYGSGLLCEIKKGGKSTKVLITCNYVINKEFLISNNEITFEINKQNKKIELVNRKIWTNKDIGYTCIQILDSDKIEQFLEVNEDSDEIFTKNFKYEKLKKKEIILFAYNEEDDDNEPIQSSEFGIIRKFRKKKLLTKYKYSLGPSGGAIVLKKNFKLIGIYAGVIKEENVFIPINIIVNDMNTNQNSIVVLNKKKGNNEENNFEKSKEDDNKIFENIFMNKNERKRDFNKLFENIFNRLNKGEKEKKMEEDAKKSVKNEIDKKENANNNVDDLQEFLSSDLINKNIDNFRELIKEMTIIPYCKNCKKDYQKLPVTAIHIVIIIIKSLKCDFCGEQDFGIKLPYKFNMKCNCGLNSKVNFPFSNLAFEFLFSLKNLVTKCGKCGEEYKIVAIEDDKDEQNNNKDEDDIKDIDKEVVIKYNSKEKEKEKIDDNEMLIVNEIIKNKKVKKELFNKSDVKGDGNCFYRCIAKKLLDNENMHKYIRKEITNNINQKRFLDYQDDFIKKQAENISKKNSWAGDLDVYLASKTFDLNIIILCNDNDNKDYYNLYPNSNNEIDIDKKSIFMLYGNSNSDLDYYKNENDQIIDKRNHYCLLVSK